MYTYDVLVKFNNGQQTMRVRVQADNDYNAKIIAESQYGYGNVLTYTRING